MRVRWDQMPKSVQKKHNPTNCVCYTNHDGSRITIVEPFEKFVYIYVVTKGWVKK